MNISAWSIRNPVPVVLIFILLSVFGLVGFGKLNIQDFPDMDMPTIQVSAVLEGAAPAQLEAEVARKIEDKLASLTLLEQINTTITDGAVALRVVFDIDKNSDVAMNEVRNAVDSARAELPASMNPPTVTKLTTANSPLLTYVVESTQLDEQDLSWFVDNQLSKTLMSVKGVSSVKRLGGVTREALVDLDPVLMASLGVTPADVSARLKAVQKESSGGRIELGGMHQSTRTIATVGSVAEIGQITIPLADGRWVRLDQIAHIHDGYAERGSYALLQTKEGDGKEVIGVQITRSLGYSDVGVAEGVRAAMQAFIPTQPQVSIREATNTIDPIQDNFHGSMALLLEGALLAIIVVWFFLRDLRATLIAAIALPLSILPTFAFMWVMDYSLNVVTLLSLALVVGILVDDAIVEIENIERHQLMGKSPYQAAMEASDEIGLAVVATTFTLVSVFLPTAFMDGIPGLVFRQFGITASVAVLASLLVARLLTPMMAAYLMKARPAASHDDAQGRIMSSYLRLAQGALRKRKTTVLCSALFFVFALSLLPFIPSAFIPVKDKAQTSVTLQLAQGHNLEDTRALAEAAAAQLITLPEIKGIFVSVGAGISAGRGAEAGAADVTGATLIVDLVARGERDLTQAQVESLMRARLRNLPGVRVAVGDGSSGQKYDLTLTSDDASLLNRTASQIEAQLRGLKGIGNVTSSAALQRPEVQVRPDYARAASLGVTAEALADTLRMATYGDYATALPKLNLPERQINIRVRMDPEVRSDLDSIAQLRLRGSEGLVNLSALADISLGSSAAQINRVNRSRNITLSVELNGRALGEVQREAMALPGLQQLPSGVKLLDLGEAQRLKELMSGFGFAMAIGIFCIYAVLVLLFHDFMQPATILSALPLAVGGALFSLWITGQSFSMPVIIGLLMLMGIVTKNSILLVEYTVLSRRKGMARLEALIDACHKRAQPIVMTTIAMGAGMLPNALGLGAEPSFRQPMAIIVIGGLLSSTVLSLVVVPVVFTYVDDLLQWIKKLFRPAQTNSLAANPH